MLSVEKELEEALYATHPIMLEASRQLLRAGGKRLRPVFVLLASKFGHYNYEKIKDVAVALELIHTASLVHDDVIDDADVRRGKPTVKAKWGNQTAIYTGDFILAVALNRITTIESNEAHQILSKTINEVTIGEIEQIQDQFNWNQTFRDYLRRIRRKTALLIAASCHLGALVSGAKKSVQTRLARFGYYVGMSFQITDDILDFVGTKKQLGKPAGGDLKQGIVTLPALFAFSNKQLKDEIINHFSGYSISDKNLKAVLDVINHSGAIESSEKVSDYYLRKAKDELSHLPNTVERESLLEIAEYIGERKY